MRHFAHARRASGPRRTPGRACLLVAGLAAVGLVLMTAGAAFAYFTATDSSNPAAALAATLTAPTGGAPNGTATNSSIPIEWTVPTGYIPASYTVLRCTGTCTPTAADAITKGTCSRPITTTSCTDTDTALQPDTTYTYGVEANLHNWISPADTFQASTSSGSASADRLAFVVQPWWHQHIRATGRRDTFDVLVAIETSTGSVVTSDDSDKVTLAINNNPGGGTLTCASSSPGRTATASRGIAVFTGCNINKAGRGYSLTATSPTSLGLAPPPDAHAFDIVAGPAARLVITSAAVSGVASSDADLGPITVQQQDSDGNPADAGFSGAIVNLVSNPSSGAVFSATRDGTPETAVTIPPGSNTASFFFGDSISGAPAVTASSLGLTSATQTETVTTPVFSAADLGNTQLSCSDGTCTGPSLTTGLGNNELIFAYVAESRSDATTLTGVTGPFSGSTASYSDQQFERVAGGGNKDNFLFAEEATGDGRTGAATLNFSDLSSNATVWIDVVQLGAGDTVVACPASCADSGVGSPASVLTQASSSADSEIAFVGTADAASFNAPSGFTGLGGGSAPYGTWANPAVAATSRFAMSVPGDGWGSIGVEVSP
jgi:hypothetical protein